MNTRWSRLNTKRQQVWHALRFGAGMNHRSLLRLVLSATFAFGPGACVPPEKDVEPATADPTTTVALTDSFVERVHNGLCTAPADLAARNPALSEDAWAARLGALTTVSAPGGHVVIDEAAIAVCEAALAANDCSAVHDACLPLDRFFVGQLAAGEACRDSVECRGVCAVEFGASCGVCVDCADDEIYLGGTCVPLLPLGAACDDDDICAQGAVCRADTRSCGDRSRVGGACAATADCNNGNACADGVCVEPPAVGEACALDDICARGAFCSAGVCRASPAEGPCDNGCALNTLCRVDDDGQATCTPTLGATCTSHGQCAPLEQCDLTTSTCVPALAPGDDCSDRGRCTEGTACFVPFLNEAPRCKTFTAPVLLGASCAAALCAEGNCVDTGADDVCTQVTFGDAVGDACTPDIDVSTCGPLLVCDSDTSRCAQRDVVPLGGRCDSDDRCANELVSATCRDGVCVARPDVGEACDPSFNLCNEATSVCDFNTLRCVAAAARAACVFSCTTGYVCGAGGRCVIDDGAVEACGT